MDDVGCEMEFLTPCIKTQIDLQFLPPKTRWQRARSATK